MVGSIERSEADLFAGPDRVICQNTNNVGYRLLIDRSNNEYNEQLYTCTLDCTHWHDEYESVCYWCLNILQGALTYTLTLYLS